MDDYREVIAKLRKSASEAVSQELRAVSGINRLLKIGIIVLSLIFTAMQFIGPGGLGAPQIVGIGAALGVAFLTLSSLLYEPDHAEELRIAAESIQISEELLEVDGILDEYELQLNRADAVTQANRFMLEFIDRSVFMPDRTDVTQALGILRCCEQALIIAGGFETGHHWTICVYRIDEARDPEQLVIVGSFRAVACDEAKARPFSKGEGVPGISWANKRTLVIEDLSDPAHASTFDLGEGKARPNDKSRYRSNVSIPIMIGNGAASPQAIWGVVTASYDEAGHFGPDGAGARRVTPFRLLAAGVAAAVSVARPSATETKGPVKDL